MTALTTPTAVRCASSASLTDPRSREAVIDLRLELDRCGSEAHVLLERLARFQHKSRYLLGGEADPARLDCHGSGGHVGEREAAIDARSNADRRADDLHAGVGDADARCGVDDAADDAAGGDCEFTLRGSSHGSATRRRRERAGESVWIASASIWDRGELSSILSAR